MPRVIPGCCAIIMIHKKRPTRLWVYFNFPSKRQWIVVICHCYYRWLCPYAVHVAGFRYWDIPTCNGLFKDSLNDVSERGWKFLEIARSVRGVEPSLYLCRPEPLGGHRKWAGLQHVHVFPELEDDQEGVRCPHPPPASPDAPTGPPAALPPPSCGSFRDTCCSSSINPPAPLPIELSNRWLCDFATEQLVVAGCGSRAQPCGSLLLWTAPAGTENKCLTNNLIHQLWRRSPRKERTC